VISMELTSFLAAIFIFLLCLLVVLKPNKYVTIFSGLLIIPLLVLVFY